MLKNLFGIMFLVATVASAAENTVAYSGKVGAQATLSQEALYLLRAATANQTELAKLTDGGYFVSAVTVEVLPATAEHFSTITRWNFTATKRRSILQISAPVQQRKLSLQTYTDYRFRDDAPSRWETSGVSAK